jgi:hypothetical protein
MSLRNDWNEVFSGLHIELAKRLVWYNEYITKGELNGLGVDIKLSRESLRRFMDIDELLEEQGYRLLIGLEDKVEVRCEFRYEPIRGLAAKPTTICDVVVTYELWDREDDIGIKVDLERELVIDDSVWNRRLSVLN